MSEKQPLMQQGNPPPMYPPPAYPNAAPSAPPPAYGYAPAPPIHHQTHTVVVTQPTPVVYQRRYGSGDHYLILSIIMSFVCFFFGTWWALACTIPAIFMAMNAQEAECRGDTITMERNRRAALRLNIGAVIIGVITWILLVIFIVARVAILASYDNNYN